MRYVMAMMGSMFLTGSAIAADATSPIRQTSAEALAESWLWFGEGTLAVHSVMLQPQGASEIYVAPYVDVGGKIALQPALSRFGAQLDLQYSGLDVRWVSPNLRASGAAGDLRGVAHVSHLLTDQLKLGAFVGLQQDYVVGKADRGGSSRVDLTTWRVGLDGLYLSSPQTTWFGHVAYLDPWRVSDGAGTDFDGSNTLWGWQAGAGVDHRMAPKWKLGAAIDVSNMRLRGEGTLTVFDVGGKIEHELGVIPGSLSLDLSWRPVVAQGFDGGFTSQNTFGLGLRYTYRFGAPEISAATTLLRY